MNGSAYRPVERLGGTRADVWLGVVDGLDGFRRPVVLKRAPVTDPMGVSDLFREARVASRLSHPHVVGALDLFEAPRELVLVLEHVHGVDARELPLPLPWPVAGRVLAEAALGLSHVHELRDFGGRPLGFVHGDVSPSNLMIAEHGATRVCDFGIARTGADVTSKRSEVVHGTRGFLSPEQARGQSIDWRSDVFSLAMVGVHLLTPPGGFQQTYVGAASRAAQVDAAPPVRTLLKRMLAVEAARRPKMSEVADLLDAAAGQAGGDVRAVASFLRSSCPRTLTARRERLAQHVEVDRLAGLLPLAEGGDEPSLTRLDDFEPTEVDLSPSGRD